MFEILRISISPWFALVAQFDSKSQFLAHCLCCQTIHSKQIWQICLRNYFFSLFHYVVSFFQYALELRVAKDSILFCDTSFTAQALVKLYLDLYEKHAEGILNTSVQLEDVVSTIELLVSDLQECSRLLSIAPQFEKQQVRFSHFERFTARWLFLKITSQI